MTELILLFQAENDIQQAFNWYEDVQEGQGKIFLEHLDLAFGLLRSHPRLGPLFSTPYRRLLIRDFPYGIFYQEQANPLIVVAVLDLRQDPAQIRKRLS